MCSVLWLCPLPPASAPIISLFYLSACSAPYILGGSLVAKRAREASLVARGVA